MAITINKHPFSVVPAHNEIEWEANSNQTAQPDFAYYITVTVVSFSKTYNFKVVPIQGKLYYSASELVKKYVSNYYPFNEYGWQSCVDGLQEFTFNIGEYYGGTVHAGSNFTLYAWNGSLMKEERRTYLPNNYEVTDNRGAGQPNNLWLNNLENGTSATGITKCKTTGDFVLYFLLTGAIGVETIEIQTYNAANSLIGTSYIANPFYPASNINTMYMCINVGFSGLINIPSGQVTGTFPIITNSVHHYSVSVKTNDGSNNYTYGFRIVERDDCQPKFDKIPIFYLNRFGAFDFINTYGNNTKTLTVTKNTYSSIQKKFEASYYNDSTTSDTIPNSPLASSRKILSSTYKISRTLWTEWLSDFESEALQDLITAPVVFIQVASGYVMLSVDDTKYSFIEASEKMKQLQIKLSDSISERRQYE